MIYLACFLAGCVLTFIIMGDRANRKQWPYEPKNCPFRVIKGGEDKEAETMMFENTIEGMNRYDY